MGFFKALQISFRITLFPKRRELNLLDPNEGPGKCPPPPLYIPPRLFLVVQFKVRDSGSSPTKVVSNFNSTGCAIIMVIKSGTSSPFSVKEK